MIYSVTRRVFIGLLALVAFFVNLTATPTKKETPPDAISVVYDETAFGDVKLFLPENVQSGADVILMIHGGAWLFGNASMFYDNCRDAARVGYIAASLNYNKIQNGSAAADMVAQVGEALSALHDALTAKGITPGKLILAGHSAGAHIMLLYAYSHYNDCPFDIAFVVSNCAAVDFLSDAETRTTTIGKNAYLLLSALTKEIILPQTLERNKAAIDAVTPLSYVSSEVPPTIVVQGTADEMIPYQNSVELYEALQRCGVDSVHITYEGAGHFLGSEFPEGNAARTAAFEDFAQKYCQP
ncbi:MAG: alpha/beta hydrolase [Clostridia bacterium]|nr:alpha/beta hydrolase [Clostridia bacterium]